jgi:hypothetical protein
LLVLKSIVDNRCYVGDKRFLTTSNNSEFSKKEVIQYIESYIYLKEHSFKPPLNISPNENNEDTSQYNEDRIHEFMNS